MKYRNYLLTLGSVFLFAVQAFAEGRPSASQFPERTIIIGTYAIALDAMTEEVLNLAEKSAKENNQEKIYYKSDINKNTWYDITDSSNISQISTTQDNIVTNQEIEEIVLTHYTKSNGTTIRFEDGKEVSIASLSDKSDPHNMEEMKEIIQERDIQNGLKENNKSNKTKKAIYESKINSIDRVMRNIERKKLDTYNKQLVNMEKAIASMQKDSNVLQENIAIAVREKIKIENEKDAFCYQTIYDRMDSELQKLDYENAQDLIDKYTNAMTALKESIAQTGVDIESIMEKELTEEEEKKEIENNSENNKKEASEADEKIETKTDEISDVLSAQSNELSKKIAEAAENGTISEIQNAIDDLVVLESVKKNDINVSQEMKQKQLAVLQDVRNTAIGQLREAQQNANNSEIYAKARQDGSSNAALQKIQSDLADTIKNAAEDLISIDNRLNDRQNSLAEKDKILASTESLLEDIEKGMFSNLKDAVSNALKEEKDNIKQQRDRIKSETIPQYQELKKTKEENEKKVSELYEKYMGMVEENKMNEADALKQEMDKAAENRNICENYMKKLEDAIKSGTLKVDVAAKTINDTTADSSNAQVNDTTNAGRDLSTSGDTNAGGDSNTSGDTNAGEDSSTSGDTNAGGDSSTSGDTNAGEDSNASEDTNTGEDSNTSGDSSKGKDSIPHNEADSQNTKDGLLNEVKEALKTVSENAVNTNIDEIVSKQENNIEEKQAQSATSEQVSSADSRYTKEEETLLNQTISSLNGKTKNYLPPWNLIFKEYSVKITVPIYQQGKEIYVPAEELANQLGAQVIKSHTGNAVIIKMGSGLIEYIPNDTTISINDKKTIVKPAPSKLYGGKIYIPLSCFEKAFGFTSSDQDGIIIVSKN